MRTNLNNPLIFRENSLDVIRLLAATQVAILHAYKFLYPQQFSSPLIEFLRLFPGVPIFFFISGYLISRSFENSPGLANYTKNRALRIYPALIICVAINIVMVWSTGYFDIVSPDQAEVFLLFFAKSSFLQFYNPAFMRSFGDGVLNGSLWTISIELQFYILTPALYFLLRKIGKCETKALLLLIIVFLLANRLLFYLAGEYSSTIPWKLYRVSFSPWLYMFLTGIVFQKNFEIISSYLCRIYAPILLLIYAITAYTLHNAGLTIDNDINPLIFFMLITVIFRFSYYKQRESNQLLRGNDISYGIYIWHMPIINQMLYFEYVGTSASVILALVLIITVALLSWKYVERPSIKLKKYSLHPF